jgi:hypothetical protein
MRSYLAMHAAIVLVPALVLTGVPALAACPTAATRNAGYKVQFESGTRVEVISYADYDLIYNSFQGSEPPLRTVTRYGLFTLSAVGRAGAVNFKYLRPMEIMLPLRTGQELTLDAVIIAEGKPDQQMRIDFVVGNPVEITVGDCTYSGINVGKMQSIGGNRTRITQIWIPDLLAALESKIEYLDASGGVLKVIDQKAVSISQ